MAVDAQTIPRPQGILPRIRGTFANCHTGRTRRTRYRWPSRAAPMRAYIVEISAKLIIRSDTDPEELPADIYSQIAEFIRNDDDLLDLEVHAVPLPADLSGSAPH